MEESSVLWEETVAPASAWSHVLKRGTSLRITDTHGGANVGAIFFNFECPVERLNLPDTLKAQHTARLTKGFVLFSDMGRVLCSITDDTTGWHDPLGGCSNARMVSERYGPSNYQDSRNEYHKNGRDSFLVESAKWGLGPRDLPASVNFFSRVDVADDGSMTYHAGNSKSGDWVELRAEMNVLAILNTCPHPLDTSTEYRPKPVRLTIQRVPPAGPGDLCRLSRPENGRGFTLTERYFL
jgi:urea carboxylase-associated protein 2